MSWQMAVVGALGVAQFQQQGAIGKYNQAVQNRKSEVLKQEAKAIERRIKRIEKAGEEGNWTADAWYLERRYPHLFGKRDTVAIENQDNPKVKLRWADGNLLEGQQEYLEGEVVEDE